MLHNVHTIGRIKSKKLIKRNCRYAPTTTFSLKIWIEHLSIISKRILLILNGGD